MGHGVYRWWKGHGTENDFVLLPDHDGQEYPDLDASRVRWLCDRRRGIGADGILRVVRSAAEAGAAPYVDDAEWFMDFRNADGSVGEMCGNGVRVFARYLAEVGLVDPAAGLVVATRAGLRPVRFHPDGSLTVGMGPARVDRTGPTPVFSLAGGSWPGVPVDVGNPHAVVMVDDLTRLPASLDATTWICDDDVFPHGVNVEFAVRRGIRHGALRVLERGVGETRSCGTGVCAVSAVFAHEDGASFPATYRVDVPGGTLEVTLAEDGRAWLRGPAVLVARGETVSPAPEDTRRRSADPPPVRGATRAPGVTVPYPG